MHRVWAIGERQPGIAVSRPLYVFRHVMVLHRHDFQETSHTRASGCIRVVPAESSQGEGLLVRAPQGEFLVQVRHHAILELDSLKLLSEYVCLNAEFKLLRGLSVSRETTEIHEVEEEPDRSERDINDVNLEKPTIAVLGVHGFGILEYSVEILRVLLEEKTGNPPGCCSFFVLNCDAHNRAFEPGAL